MAAMDRASEPTILQRRGTDETIDRFTEGSRLRRSPNAAWYTPGVDFCFYAPAQNACAKSIQRLRGLKLLDDEHRLLQSSLTAIEPRDIHAKLLQIQSEQLEKSAKRPQLLKASSKFINSFCAFADNVSHIVQILIPQSPEYSVTFGLLFIIFRAVVTKKDREDALTLQLESIGAQLPLMEFYKTVFPTDALKATVSRIYVHIMTFLDDAVVYYRSGRLSKLIDAMCQPLSKFEEYIGNIQRECQSLNDLKDAGHIAQTADMMEIVSGTGRLVASLHNEFTSKANAIATSMEILNSKLDALAANNGQLLHFAAIQNAQSLQECLLKDDLQPDDEMHAVVAAGFHLSQKDHWESNGVLDVLLDWSRRGRDQLIWVGGSSGNQDSWVTELSTDLVSSLQLQGVSLVHIFCSTPGTSGLTVETLVRRLIVRLLELYPRLSYERPEICNSREFRNAKTFLQLWRIFERLIASIPNLFIIVDRIEECVVDEAADMVNDLVPSLIRLACENENISVLVTSIFDPPDELSGLAFYKTYIDTSMKHDQYQMKRRPP